MPGDLMSLALVETKSDQVRGCTEKYWPVRGTASTARTSVYLASTLQGVLYSLDRKG